jgi:hypothetical protein
MRFPIKASFAIRQVDGDFILHDRRSDTVHRLNSVAAVIWQLCDGTRDPSAIVSEVALIFGKSRSEIGPDVEEILARFMDAGLVHSSAATPELDVLLRCVETAIGSPRSERIATSFGTDLDWVHIERTAFQHGVMPLLYKGLRQQADVPVDVLQRLEQSFSVNAELNRFLFRELLGLLALFDANDVPAVPIKGPTLALSLYDDVALRQFGDLDILVPPDRVARAKTLLEARGCRFRLSGEASVLAEYDSESRTVGVDLHWAFGPKRRAVPIDLDEFWARTVRVSVGSTSMLQPSPEDQVRILTAHGAKHCWSKLRWIADMAACMCRHRDTVNWEKLIGESRQSGGERLILLGARLASDVLGTAVPVGLAPAMQADAAASALATELRLRLFAPEKHCDSVRGSYGAIEGGLLYVKARERVQDRLPYLWHVLGHPFRRLVSLVTPNYRDEAVVALPRGVAFLYYLVRPARLTADYWAGFLQRFHYLRE